MRIIAVRALFLAPFLATVWGDTALAQNAAMQTVSGLAQTLAADGQEQQVLMVDFAIAKGGTYVLSVPSKRGIAVRLNGATIIDNVPFGAEAADTITALVSIIPGQYRVELIGTGISEDLAEAVLLKRLGRSEGSSLASLSSTLPAFSVKSSVETNAARAPMNSIQSNIRMATKSASQPSGAPTVAGTRAARNIRSVIDDSLAIGNPTPPPPVNGGAASSPLGPPSGVSLTQAIEIIGIAAEDSKVAATGQTLFGRVMDPETFDTVNATIAPSGRIAILEVGPAGGGFALRLFEEDLVAESVTVTVSAGSSSDQSVSTEPMSYNYTAASATDGVGITLARTTFGPTAELYARVRAVGYRTYIEEQLSPETIDDRAFENMNFDRLLDRDTYDADFVAASLQAHNVATAAFTEKQLQEVMGSFWSNHLHASNKNTGVLTQAFDDRQFYRDNAMGRFEDLLLYSARSPLMSQFLDNDQSKVDKLNENYGREILELHTVGVNAGYGDEDVIAVSKIFTGWTFRRTNPNAHGEELFEFEFKPEDHDSKDKYIPFLDVTIEGRSGPAGVEEGEELIALLAKHESTQNFVCGKIVQWFVSDRPPANFVEMCMNAWEAHKGESREILRAILLAPEFVTTPELRRTKGKNPLEYTVSVLRAAGVEPQDLLDTNIWYWFGETARNAGYSPAEFQVPTGLPEFGKAWANTSTFVAKYNAGSVMFANWRNSDVLLEEEFVENDLETAEEVAAYILAIGTGDIYRQDEFDAMVDALKGPDGVFLLNHITTDVALGRAITLLTVLPSFHLQ